MGWKGYSTSIDVGMLFKKMHCGKCGEKLKKQKIVNLLKKGDQGYHNHIALNVALGMDRLQKTTYVYKCPGCGDIITYDEQMQILRAQKQENKRTL